MIKAIAWMLAAAFFAALAAPAQAQDAAQGQKKASMCIGCHGIAGYQASFPQVHKVPMISGQGAKYLVAALTEYKRGDRRHPSMRAIAMSLTETDIADLAAFYQQHGVPAGARAPAAPPAPPADVAPLLAKGACATCHGANFSQPLDPSYPKIAGQHADYLAAALHAYATSGNPHIGRGNAIMVAQVKQFTPTELKALARYIGSLPAELYTVPQPKFR